MNGGSWNGEICLCPNGFTGDRCQNRVPTVACQNGGMWDGLKCQCTSLFHGPRCEEVVDSIEIDNTVSATVEVSVTVTNHNYSEELQNKTSKEFKEFNKTFTEQMEHIYDGIPEYEGVVINSLRKGSIVVDYDVILKAKYTDKYESVLQNVSSTVREKIENATKYYIVTNNSCPESLCFNSSATNVQNTSWILNSSMFPSEQCQKQAGEEYAKYVFLESKDNKLQCVTACSTGYKTPWTATMANANCSRSGPQCICLTTDTHWYSGETCDRGIQKSLVYGLVGAGVAVLLVILVVLSVFSMRFRREAKRQTFKVSQMQKWNEEEGKTPGAVHNVGFDHNEEGENYVHLDSMYSNFEGLPTPYKP
ncbi:mucin-17-like [Phodopus roborovskii]|uniref:mucin-17-like n=1 Tax=Phodopus roborovskii TaxID=109678 RepID=UPI0021E3894F|nr:mucin-17-like [Phodopus roborovskii]